MFNYRKHVYDNKNESFIFRFEILTLSFRKTPYNIHKHNAKGAMRKDCSDNR